MNSLVAFTAEQVSRLTGLSDHQLRYWDSTGFFRPSLADEPKRPYGRVYSFRDVVGLRAIAIIRNKHGIPLQELRKLGAWLEAHYDQPLVRPAFLRGRKRRLFRRFVRWDATRRKKA